MLLLLQMSNKLLTRVFKTLVYTFIILALIEERVLAFRAWDCAGNNTASITIDLTEPQMCENIESYYHDPSEVRAQIMAVDVRRGVDAYQCKAVEDSDVTRCGFDRYQSNWGAVKGQTVAHFK